MRAVGALLAALLLAAGLGALMLLPRARAEQPLQTVRGVLLDVRPLS